jgi:hypothetical protein
MNITAAWRRERASTDVWLLLSDPLSAELINAGDAIDTKVPPLCTELVLAHSCAGPFSSGTFVLILDLSPVRSTLLRNRAPS